MTPTYHIGHVIPLQDALICCDCPSVIEGPTMTCPRCTSTALMPLSVWLNQDERFEVGAVSCGMEEMR